MSNLDTRAALMRQAYLAAGTGNGAMEWDDLKDVVRDQWRAVAGVDAGIPSSIDADLWKTPLEIKTTQGYSTALQESCLRNAFSIWQYHFGEEQCSMAFKDPSDAHRAGMWLLSYAQAHGVPVAIAPRDIGYKLDLTAEEFYDKRVEFGCRQTTLEQDNADLLAFIQSRIVPIPAPDYCPDDVAFSSRVPALEAKIERQRAQLRSNSESMLRYKEVVADFGEEVKNLKDDNKLHIEQITALEAEVERLKGERDAAVDLCDSACDALAGEPCLDGTWLTQLNEVIKERNNLRVEIARLTQPVATPTDAQVEVLAKALNEAYRRAAGLKPDWEYSSYKDQYIAEARAAYAHIAAEGGIRANVTEAEILETMYCADGDSLPEDGISEDSRYRIEAAAVMALLREREVVDSALRQELEAVKAKRDIWRDRVGDVESELAQAREQLVESSTFKGYLEQRIATKEAVCRSCEMQRDNLLAELEALQEKYRRRDAQYLEAKAREQREGTRALALDADLDLVSEILKVSRDGIFDEIHRLKAFAFKCEVDSVCGPDPEELARIAVREWMAFKMTNVPYDALPSEEKTAMKCMAIAVWNEGRNIPNPLVEKAMDKFWAACKENHGIEKPTGNDIHTDKNGCCLYCSKPIPNLVDRCPNCGWDGEYPILKPPVMPATILDAREQQTTPRPVEVRFDVTAEEFANWKLQEFGSGNSHTQSRAQMDYLAAHAVIDLPEGVPSAEELVQVYLDGCKTAGNTNDPSTYRVLGICAVIARLAPYLHPKSHPMSAVRAAAKNWPKPPNGGTIEGDTNYVALPEQPDIDAPTLERLAEIACEAYCWRAKGEDECGPVVLAILAAAKPVVQMSIGAWAEIVGWDAAVDTANTINSKIRYSVRVPREDVEALAKRMFLVWNKDGNACRVGYDKWGNKEFFRDLATAALRHFGMEVEG